MHRKWRHCANVSGFHAICRIIKYLNICIKKLDGHVVK